MNFIILLSFVRDFIVLRCKNFFMVFLKKYLHFKNSSHIITLALRRYSFETDKIEYALLAQLVEHLTLNQGVQGSSP